MVVLVVRDHDIARVLVTMWAIWWARRHAIHDEEFQCPLSTMAFINRYLEDLEIVAEHASKYYVRKVPGARPKQAPWRPSEGLTVKINVDGGLARNGRRGAAAAVCKDSSGYFLGALAIVIEGLVDPPSLEAQACNKALALAADMNVASVLIASDCLEVVNSINQGCFSSYAPIIREIQHRRTSFGDTTVRYEARESNHEAHRLAKASFALDAGRHLWPGSPPDISCIPMSVNFE